MGAGPSLDGDLADAKQLVTSFNESFAKHYQSFFSSGLMHAHQRRRAKVASLAAASTAASGPAASVLTPPSWLLLRCPDRIDMLLAARAVPSPIAMREERSPSRTTTMTTRSVSSDSPTDDPLPVKLAVDSPPPRRKGYMLKLSQYLLQWNLRYFVVRGDSYLIDYWENEDQFISGAAPKKTLNVSGMEVHRDPNQAAMARLEAMAKRWGTPAADIPKPPVLPENTILLFHSRRGALHLHCHSAEDYTEWCSVLEDCRWHSPALTEWSSSETASTDSIASLIHDIGGGVNAVAEMAPKAHKAYAFFNAIRESSADMHRLHAKFSEESSHRLSPTNSMSSTDQQRSRPSPLRPGAGAADPPTSSRSLATSVASASTAAGSFSSGGAQHGDLTASPSDQLPCVASTAAIDEVTERVFRTSGGGEVNVLWDTIVAHLEATVMQSVDAKMTMPWLERKKQRDAFLESVGRFILSTLTPTWASVRELVRRELPEWCAQVRFAEDRAAGIYRSMLAALKRSIEPIARSAINERFFNTPWMAPVVHHVLTHVKQSLCLTLRAFDAASKKAIDCVPWLIRAKATTIALVLVAQTCWIDEFLTADRHLGLLRGVLFRQQDDDAAAQQGDERRGVLSVTMPRSVVADHPRPWRVVQGAQKRLSKLFRSALYTFASRVAEGCVTATDVNQARLHQQQIAHETRSLMMLDCKTALVHMSTKIVRELVSSDWQTQLPPLHLTGTRALASAVSVPNDLRAVVAVAFLMEDFFKDVLHGGCAMSVSCQCDADDDLLDFSSCSLSVISNP